VGDSVNQKNALFNTAVSNPNPFAQSYPRFQIIGGRAVMVNEDFEGNIRDSFESIGVVYSIIDIMTKKISTIPRYLYQVNLNQQQKLAKIKTYSQQTIVSKKMLTKGLSDIHVHPFLDLLNNPNSHQTSGEFIKQLFGYRYITGNTFIRINCGQSPGTPITGKSKPVELQILPSQYIQVLTDFQDPWSVIGYRLRQGAIIDFDPSEIIHFKYPNYDFNVVGKTHLYGMSPLKAATLDITAAKYLKMAQASQAQNEGAKGLLVRNDDFELSEEQRDLVQERVDQEINGAMNKGRSVVTNANIRWEQIGMSAQDMKLVETFQLGKEDIANIYNFPIHLLSSVTSTLSNLDTSVKYLTTNTIMSDLVDFRDMINVFIKRFYGENLWYEFDISDMPELADDMNKMAQSMKDWYWITPNEKRMLTKWEERVDPNMDKIYVPSGYVPIERLNQDPFGQALAQLGGSTGQTGMNDYNNGQATPGT